MELFAGSIGISRTREVIGDVELSAIEAAEAIMLADIVF
jgi:hypothetical protein